MADAFDMMHKKKGTRWCFSTKSVGEQCKELRDDLFPSFAIFFRKAEMDTFLWSFNLN